MKLLPFFRLEHHDTVASSHGMSLYQNQFLGDVAGLASRLPERPYVLNQCADRYHFLVGFAAAMVRGQISLFPSSNAPQLLEQLKDEYPDAYCLCDSAQDTKIFPVFYYEDGATPAEIIVSAPLAFPPDQTAVIAFTSGSTGRPRPYIKSWGGFVHEALVAGRSLGLEQYRGRHLVATVPPQHMYGFIASIMLPLQYGLVIDTSAPFYPEDIRHTLASYDKPVIFVTTPVHIRACVRERIKFPRTTFVLSSTAPLAATLSQQAEVVFNAPLFEFYGSTETGAIALRRQAETQVWRVFDDITINLDHGGFQVASPYFAAITLSDQVEVRSAREFVLFGRNTDLVKVAGKRASLAELNAHLLDIDGVVDGTFFVQDEQESRETRLTAFVVAPGKTREDILLALRERIDAVFLPRPLRLVSALPRNATGKLPRGNLIYLMQADNEIDLR